MGYQGMLVEMMTKEYVVLATSQSQSLMCGGQMSLNKHAMEGWAPIEPQIVWNRSAVLSLPLQASPGKPERQQHYVAVSQQLADRTPEAAKLMQPRLPQRNPGGQLIDSPREVGATPRDEQDLRHLQMPAMEKSSAKEAAAKGKKRFRIFRAMRSVIKSRFRK